MRDNAWYTVCATYLLLFLLPSHLITAWHKFFPRRVCLLIPLFASVSRPFCLACDALLLLKSLFSIHLTDLPTPFPPFLPCLGIWIFTKDMRLYVSWQGFPCLLSYLHILALECESPGRIWHFFCLNCVFSYDDNFIALEKFLKFCLSVGSLCFLKIRLKKITWIILDP